MKFNKPKYVILEYQFNSELFKPIIVKGDMPHGYFKFSDEVSAWLIENKITAKIMNGEAMFGEPVTMIRFHNNDNLMAFKLRWI